MVDPYMKLLTDAIFHLRAATRASSKSAVRQLLHTLLHTASTEFSVSIRIREWEATVF